MWLQVTGSITYNGRGFDQFRAAHTAAYVDQNDLHQPELTVRETFDFAARCQGVGHKAGEAYFQAEAMQGCVKDVVYSSLHFWSCSRRLCATGTVQQLDHSSS